MKKNEFQQLKSKSTAEWEKELNENRTKLQNLKFDLAAGKVKNVQEVKKTKKVIARLLTLLKQEKSAS